MSGLVATMFAEAGDGDVDAYLAHMCEPMADLFGSQAPKDVIADSLQEHRRDATFYRIEDLDVDGDDATASVVYDDGDGKGQHKGETTFKRVDGQWLACDTPMGS